MEGHAQSLPRLQANIAARVRLPPPLPSFSSGPSTWLWALSDFLALSPTRVTDFQMSFGWKAQSSLLMNVSLPPRWPPKFLRENSRGPTSRLCGLPPPVGADWGLFGYDRGQF